MKRVIFDILLIIFIFILPWWVNVALVFMGIFLFDKFYEFIITLVILYSLYMIEGTTKTSSIIFAGVLINVMYFGIQILKSQISFYKSDTIKLR
jgi:hypothetical protein